MTVLVTEDHLPVCMLQKIFIVFVCAAVVKWTQNAVAVEAHSTAENATSWWSNSGKLCGPIP